MQLFEIKSNPNNPRKITPERLDILKSNILKLPKMMSLRPIVIDSENIVIGGNQRLAALQALGYTEIPDEWIKRADELTEEETRLFIIMDNTSIGEWDIDAILRDFSDIDVESLGVELPSWATVEEPDLQALFEEGTVGDKIPKEKIVLEYTSEEYEQVIAAFKDHKGSKEQIVFNLLGLS
jgi:hypothetical protein